METEVKIVNLMTKAVSVFQDQPDNWWAVTRQARIFDIGEDSFDSLETDTNRYLLDFQHGLVQRMKRSRKIHIPPQPVAKFRRQRDNIIPLFYYRLRLNRPNIKTQSPKIVVYEPDPA